MEHMTEFMTIRDDCMSVCGGILGEETQNTGEQRFELGPNHLEASITGNGDFLMTFTELLTLLIGNYPFRESRSSEAKFK